MKALSGSLAIIIIAFCSFFSDLYSSKKTEAGFFAGLECHNISSLCGADFSAVYAIQPANQGGFIQKWRKCRRNFMRPRSNMCFEASVTISPESEASAELFYEPFLSKYGGPKIPPRLRGHVICNKDRAIIPQAEVLLI